MKRLVVARGVTEQDVEAARSEHGWPVEYTYDPELDVAFLTVADELAGDVANAIHVSTPDGLMTAFAIAPLAIARLGVAAPETADPVLLECFAEAFEHESEEVRRVAAIAAGYPRWPELRPALERLAAEDPDPAVRSSAEAVLRAS